MKTAIDTGSEVFRSNQEINLDKVADLEAEHAKAWQEAARSTSNATVSGAS